MTRIAGGIAGNVIPDLAEAHVNYRYAPGRSPAEAEARLRRAVRRPASCGSTPTRPPAPSRRPTRSRAGCAAAGDLEVAPKQAWTPVAEFGAAGIEAINFGPGEPAQAHTRDGVDHRRRAGALPAGARGVRVSVRLSPVLRRPAHVPVRAADRRQGAAARAPASR